MIPQTNTNPTMERPESGVKVRMYNPGFGDCFLLAFRAKDNSARYMLIDCGVHHQYPGNEARMRRVAKDIAKVTGKHLHVVVATHEHTDHLYGFYHAKDIFEDATFKIDELWLAWTENPRDRVARELKQLYGKRMRALTAAVDRLKLAKAPLAEPLRTVLNFEFQDALSATSKNAPLKFLRTKSKKKLQRAEDYRRAGEKPITLPDVKDVKFYILGPPREVKWIKKLEKKGELYPRLQAVDEATAFAAAALAAGTARLSDEDNRLFKQSRPFSKHLGISETKATGYVVDDRLFFQEHYGFPKRRKNGPKWRRIDNDWLAAAEQLALNINKKTNNTSLVLAIELMETLPRKVLLFAADAQMGNWLSWHKLEWPGEGQDGDTVTAADLLRRTVLYKVGHHGSHNATLREKGLEMMASTDLIAMIPVDEEWARSKKPTPWKMPFKSLLKALKVKTKGRIIRADEIPAGNQPPKKSHEATLREWRAFKNQLDWDRNNQLWIEYTVPG